MDLCTLGNYYRLTSIDSRPRRITYYPEDGNKNVSEYKLSTITSFPVIWYLLLAKSRPDAWSNTNKRYKFLLRVRGQINTAVNMMIIVQPLEQLIYLHTCIMFLSISLNNYKIYIQHSCKFVQTKRVSSRNYPFLIVIW